MFVIKPSMEAIGFQQESLLFTELTIFFTALLSENNARGATLDAIAGVVAKRTNLKVMVSVTPAGTDAFVCLPPLLTDNPVFDKSYQSKISKLSLSQLNFKGIFNGAIDYKEGTVSGDFTRLRFDITLTEALVFKSGLLPEELAALFVHEVGHCYTYLSLFSEMVRTNMVMHEIARVFSDTREEKVRIDSLELVEKLYGVKFEDKKALATNHDPDTVASTVAGLACTRLRSVMGSSHYDERLAEFLADQFAARHGAARYVVAALDKLERAHKSIDTQGALAGWHQPFSVGLLAAVVSLSGVASLGLVSAGLLSSLSMMVYDSVKRTERYDNLYDRYAALERETIAHLKDASLPRHVVQRLLTDLDVIRGYMQRLNLKNYPIQRLVEFIADSFTGRRREVQFQQFLEKMGNNILFSSAAKLNDSLPT